MFHRVCDIRSAVCCVAFMAAAGVGSSAYGQVFANNAPIAIPDSGTATPYPSTISIAGVPGVAGSQVGGIKVRLKGITHTFMGDVGALLVAPNGQGFQLLNFNSGNVSNLTLTFDAASVVGLPDPLVTGTFTASGGATVFAAPAHAIPRAAVLADLTNGNVNGVWKLYVQDFAAGDLGAFAGGWEIEFGNFGTAPAPFSTTAFTYQGRLDGGPANGTVDARFTLWTDATATTQINRFAAPVTVSGIAVANGVFTTAVDFGVQVPVYRETWLQIEIASPAGGGFVSLSPRQRMAITPLAGAAAALGSNTVTSDTATIGGRQVDNVYFTDASLTLQAPGQPGFSGFGTPGGELRLRGGNNNNASNSPTPGVSNGGDIAMFAGQNFWTGRGWNGNIRFHGGNNQPELMRIVGDNGNVGIGTTTPAAKLDVRGSIALGDGTLRAASGSEDLRLLRGTFAFGANTLAGSGFTVARPITGTYTITFTTPFGGVPSISANAFDTGSPLTIAIATVTATQATILVRNNAGTPTNAQISFTVMGPR